MYIYKTVGETGVYLIVTTKTMVLYYAPWALFLWALGFLWNLNEQSKETSFQSCSTAFYSSPVVLGKITKKER